MITRNFSRGERLRPSLVELEPDDALVVPYRLYSESSIRATVSVFSASCGRKFRVQAGQTEATIKRIS